MAYDYLGLVNDINRRLNEVELTSSNFINANGEYGMIKDAVNSAIRYINQHEYEWPFNHVQADETLTAGIVRYAFPSDAKTIDFDSFRIKRNDTLGNDTKRLRIISYEEYLDKYIDGEYNTSAGIRAVPDYVFRSPSQEFGFVRTPDKAYEVAYEYMFRGETQEANLVQGRFIDEIKNMRSLYVNRYDYLRSTALDRNRTSVSSFRIS